MIRLGTRGSALARAQAGWVADRLDDAELVVIETAGDRDRERRYDQIGDGRAVFTREIEQALLDGRIDVAVHSAKDLTGDMPAGLEIAAVPEREDPRDACCGPYGSLAEIPAGARIGTSSARRAGLLGVLRPDLEVVPLRGNVDTRLRKLDAGEADAIVLAAAGLVRLGLLSRIGFLFDPAVFVPEAGPGSAGAAGAKRRGGAGVVARPLAVAPARGRRARPGRGAGRRLHGAGGGARLVRAGRAARAVVGGAVTVYLVGAGPGDPGLLTVRGRELLGRCDALVYDRLADPRIVALAPASAERVYAGKEPDRHALSQEQINALLVELAGRHSCVVRLKGGDPFVFGRGGEEAQVLAQAGIDWEVVPGISSAYAVPAYAGIPVTQRGVAAQFTVVTGHEDPTKPESDLDWASLASTPGTLVFLMGVRALRANAARLIEQGMAGGYAGRGDLPRHPPRAAHGGGAAVRDRRGGGRSPGARDHAGRRRRVAPRAAGLV